MSFLDDKTLLLTGGTGSFGQEFCKVVLSEHKPRAIRVYSRSELPQVEMERRFEDDHLRFFIGDVRDKERLARAMRDVQVVIHAAALKHVPICEYNPIEAIRTNVLGTMNVIECALDVGVERAILISTDKSVAALNLYGCTKAVAERLFVQANTYSGGGPPLFSAVRYGNVANSRGSIVPLVLEQRESGVVSLTDERMTRFWLTLNQGVRFVLFALDQMMGGEVFIPKLSSVRVVDLVSALAPSAQVQTIGIRPGEKLAEVLISRDEVSHVHEYGDYFVLQPAFPFWRKGSLIGGSPLSEEFSYSSDQNPLPKELIGQLLEESHIEVK